MPALVLSAKVAKFSKMPTGHTLAASFYDLYAARPSPLTAEAHRRTTRSQRKSVANRLISDAARGKPAQDHIDDLEIWLRTSIDKLLLKFDTSAKIMYALKQWPALYS